MKKFALAFLLFAFVSLHAQDFQGMAVYESKTSTGDILKSLSGNKNITPDMQKMIEERMKSMFEKTFILNFDKSASIYKEEEKLEAPGQQGMGMRMASSMMGGGGTHYKNIKDKTFTVDREFMGKEFLVHDSLPKLDWKLESESKKIGDYTCYKATAIKAASKSDFRNFRRKNEKDESETADKKTNIMDQYDMPKEITITAWYAPEIPVSQGPENYWGLPGLILEVNDGKTTILCSKIVLNTKEKAAIKAPTNGKAVNQKEYDETVTSKLEEMKQMGGGGTRIRMGN